MTQAKVCVRASTKVESQRTLLSLITSLPLLHKFILARRRRDHDNLHYTASLLLCAQDQSSRPLAARCTGKQSPGSSRLVRRSSPIIHRPLAAKIPPPASCFHAWDWFRVRCRIILHPPGSSPRIPSQDRQPTSDAHTQPTQS